MTEARIAELERELAEARSKADALQVAAESSTIRSRVMERERMMTELVEELRARLDGLDGTASGEPALREVARSQVLWTARKIAALE